MKTGVATVGEAPVNPYIAELTDVPFTACSMARAPVMAIAMGVSRVSTSFMLPFIDPEKSTSVTSRVLGAGFDQFLR